MGLNSSCEKISVRTFLHLWTVKLVPKKIDIKTSITFLPKSWYNNLFDKQKHFHIFAILHYIRRRPSIYYILKEKTFFFPQANFFPEDSLIENRWIIIKGGPYSDDLLVLGIHHKNVLTKK